MAVSFIANTSFAAGTTYESPRGKTYDVGGIPPYGFVLTPGYTPWWAPNSGINEVSLYERIDWSGGVTDTQAPHYQNPPFIGVGSTSAPNAIPSWMQGDNPAVPKRILRGYLRRKDITPLSLPGLSNEDKASNARLFFMYNPPDLTRNYMAYADTQNITNFDPNATLNAGLPPPVYASMDVSLFFDRQEEVSRFPNHPGCLLDLAVFDLLARGGAGTVSAADITKAADAALATTTGATDTTPGITAGNDIDVTSLIVSTSLTMVLVASPNLAFEGIIQSAVARFDKFSHRMTPTRMELALTFMITYAGKENPATTHQPGWQQAAAQAKSLADAKAAANPPNYVVEGGQTAVDDANFYARYAAMQWAAKWTVEAGIVPNLHQHGTGSESGKEVAPNGGVPYASSRTGLNRSANWQNDKIDDYTQPHWPGAFDCSSLIWRSYNVLGWTKQLGLSLNGDYANASDSFIQTASDHPSVWMLHDFKHFSGFVIDPEEWFVKNVRAGDLLVKRGQLDNGHIAFVYQKVEDPAPAGLAYKDQHYRILHSHASFRPVEYSDSAGAGAGGGGGGSGSANPTVSAILNEYSVVLRPQAIGMPVKLPAATGSGSW